jgi:hypothetical protein
VKNRIRGFQRSRKLTVFFFIFGLASAAVAQNGYGKAWQFAVSGDSRNCGDVVMPGIAAGAIRNQAAFYWHLGDLRAIYDFDQDFKQIATSQAQSPRIIDYENQAWDDFIQNQILPFGSIPFYLGIGNHETIPPKTRAEFVAQFADWLNTPVLQQQRFKDDPKDHRLKTYYHWILDGIDFINLDNASHDQFDADQLKWFEGVAARDAASASIRAVVVGMHAALPESISADHSMNEWPEGEQSGRRVYQDLLKLQNEAHKKIYVLASHSHFFMDGIFNTAYWRAHGGVLPGWIVGTAGAVRYALPPNANDAKTAKTNVYGYLLATVNPSGQGEGAISFEFQRLEKEQVPAEVVQRFTQPFVDECFLGNRR